MAYRLPRKLSQLLNRFLSFQKQAALFQNITTRIGTAWLPFCQDGSFEGTTERAWLLIKNSIQLEPRQRDDVLIDLSGPISGKNNIAYRGLLGIFLNELT